MFSFWFINKLKKLCQVTTVPLKQLPQADQISTSADAGTSLHVLREFAEALIRMNYHNYTLQHIERKDYYYLLL